MFDTMTATKILGSICGALLFFVVLGFVGTNLYSTPSGVLAIAIEVDDPDAAVAVVEEEEEVSFEDLLASADLGRGERAWASCRACHSLEAGVNGVGPYMHGVVGREVAAVDGFNYSSALESLDGVWDVDALNAFLLRPSDYAPGNRMSYAGMPRDQQRADLILFLKSLTD
ncbi:MAG: c-type cytochrome [Rhodobacteraceae bacterium]|nr:c-type cytochrome [Paracoccaceae bacterium]